MSGGGSSKPAEVKATEGEKTQAALAKDQIDYYRSTYAPLEQEYLREANQDPSARLSAQAATASTRETTDALRTAALGNAPVDTGALAGATTASRIAGATEGRRQRDDMRLDALKVGLGVSADATRSLSDAASVQTSAAIDRTREQIAKQQASNGDKEAVIGGLASVGGMYLGYKLPQMQRQRLTQQKALGEADRQTNKISTGTAYRDARGIY